LFCFCRVKPDDFEFCTCIGKGSFGKVYLARHKTEDTIYAVKVVSKALIKRKREERHIMAERDVLVKNTRHPFLVSLQYSFQTPDKLYFVMDFVNGGEVCLFYLFNILLDLIFSSYSFIYNKNEHLMNNEQDFMLLK
jgi:serine/threonine protein kinase